MNGPEQEGTAQKHFIKKKETNIGLLSNTNNLQCQGKLDDILKR